MRYAKGKRAWGMCTRCGARDYVSRLVSDGQKPGLLVHQSCRDMKHPAEKPFRTEEGMMLKQTSPNLEDDSGGAGSSLAAAFQFDSGFGLADGYVLDGYVTDGYVGST